MGSKRVVVTGANSHLGGNLIRFLTQSRHWNVYAISSHRSAADLPEDVPAFRHDLTRPLPDGIRDIVGRADAIIHFAWARDWRPERACELNRQMLEHLLACASQPSNFYFISSIAASPTAKSIYGRTKYELASLAARRGAVVIACGLVIDNPPHGPHALLIRCIRSLPLRIRFTEHVSPIYSIEIQQMCARIAQAIEVPVVSGQYKLCEAPIEINSMIAEIEQKYPRRRIPVITDARVIRAIASSVGPFRLMPWRLADKILTFLHKDEAYLDSLPDLRTKLA